ncbi:hypothetical protein [Euzebya pacifica]|nr:hypothetical protein [Euzebya pacifica]
MEEAGLPVGPPTYDPINQQYMYEYGPFETLELLEAADSVYEDCRMSEEAAAAEQWQAQVARTPNEEAALAVELSECTAAAGVELDVPDPPSLFDVERAGLESAGNAYQICRASVPTQ